VTRITERKKTDLMKRIMTERGTTARMMEIQTSQAHKETSTETTTDIGTTEGIMVRTTATDGEIIIGTKGTATTGMGISTTAITTETEWITNGTEIEIATKIADNTTTATGIVATDQISTSAERRTTP